MVQTRFRKVFVGNEVTHQEGVIPPQQMIRYALLTSGAHDQAVRSELSYRFVDESQSWVVTQYRLNLLAPYEGESDLTVETLVCEGNRFFVNRRFRFYEGARLFATVEAQYVILDLVKRRMVRVPIDQFEAAHLIVAEEAPAHFDPMKFEGDQVLQTIQQDLAITPAVIDENGHVNNLVYIGWALDQLQALAPYSSLYIKYGSELLPSDQVAVHSQLVPLGDDQWLSDHQIMNQSKGKVACLVQIVWTQPVALAPVTP